MLNHRQAAFALFKAASPSPPWPCKDPEGKSLEHAVWMLQMVWNLNITGDKADRWLGWAACLLVTHNRLTLTKVKEIIAENISRRIPG